MHVTYEALPPETVVRLDDPQSRLNGFIVVHSTALGPAAGGCRLWHYSTTAAAGDDAMRLAAGMTMKNALAGLPLGGGKAVLMLPEVPFDRVKLFAAFGRAVRELGGQYVTAEDVGTSVDDMAGVAHITSYVAGLPPEAGQPGGDPSPWTARGVFLAMEVAVRRRLGRSLDGVAVGVQGVGNVGMALCELLHNAGARLVIAENQSERGAQAAARFGADLVSSRYLADAPIDVFAPCALGGALNLDVLSRLRAKIVCGAANNQLATPEIGEMLASRGVLYAPDFLVNAGGIISVAAEYLGWNEQEVPRRVAAISDRLTEVLDLAETHDVSPAKAAVLAARKVIEASKAPKVAVVA